MIVRLALIECSCIMLTCPVVAMAGPSLQGMKMHVFEQQNDDTTLTVPTTTNDGARKNLKMIVFDGAYAYSNPPQSTGSSNYRISADKTSPVQLKEYPRRPAPTDAMEVTSYAEAGYRHDQLKWNKAAPGGTPNVLSELQWNNIESAVFTAGTDISFSDNWHLEGEVSYGQIMGGENQDSDYLLNDRQGEFSRSNNQADDGHLIDLTAAVGYNFNLGHDKSAPHWRFTPKAGFGFHNQKFKITDGYQTIPAYGSFANLNSSYEANWLGPLVGLNTQFALNERFSVNGSFEYYWVDYDGTGHWNLRSDLQQPKSFTQKASGNGIVASAVARYLMTPDWMIRLSVDYQNWLANDDGQDKMYFSNGSTAEMQFNEAKWQSYGVNLGVEYVF